MNAQGRFAIISLIVATLAGGCAKDPQVAKREYLQSADAFAAEGRLPEAIVQYRNAVQQDPLYGEARHKLAQALEKTGDLTSAYREYIRAADLLPNDAAIQLKAGQMLLGSRQFEDAQARADKVLALNPASVEGRILRGNALAGLQDVAAAISEIEEAIKADPDRGLTFIDLGRVQSIAGDATSAERSFRQAVELSPSSVEVREALANFYVATNSRNLAEQSLKEALALDPERTSVNRSLALLYVAEGRLVDAEPRLKLVVAETGDVNSRLVLAEIYRRTDRLPLALETLDALGADPNNFIQSRTRKAALLFAAGRKPEAYAAIQEALDKQAQSGEALLQKAIMLGADGDYQQALTTALSAIVAEPASVRGRFEVGRLYTVLGQVDEAMAAYQETLRLAPRYVPAMVGLSRLHLVLRRPDDALRFAEAALAVQPRDADAIFYKARALLAQGKPEMAAEPMRLLAANLPSSPAVQAQLGSLYMQQGNRSAARAAYERALRSDASSLEALTGLTALDFLDRRGSEAKNRVDRAVSAHPENAHLLTLSARVYSSLGDRPAAERMARQAIEIEPSSIDAYVMLGMMYAADRRLDEAILQFEEIGKRRPSMIAAPTMVGMLLELQNKREDAAKKYQQVLELDPRAAVAANNLAMFHLDTGGNLDVALTLAQTAKAGLPERHEVNDTLGLVYVRKGLGAMAVPRLLEAVEAAPTNASYHYHLGQAYVATGDILKARSAFEKALSLDGESPLAAEVQQALAAVKG